MSVKQDVRTIVGKSVSVPLSAAALTIELGADGIELIESGIKAAPSIGLSLLKLPFAAVKGYLVQEGASEHDAEERAYRYVKQDLSRTITELGEGSGKLLSDLLKEDDLEAAVARREEPTIEQVQ